ncbi:MAG: gamma-glutamyl-phosphate reductase, partial [Deltaproteobacteria bacterium]
MSIAEQMLKIAQDAKAASQTLASLSSAVKNELLQQMAQALLDHSEELIESNEKDLSAAREAGLAPAMVDRLALDVPRIRSMADGLREVAELPDPVGEITGMWRRPNDLQIGRMRVPLGVIGIVYESRPNVTADAAGLCLKSGNAVILRGGKEAIHSNLAISKVLKSQLERMRLPT